MCYVNLICSWLCGPCVGERLGGCEGKWAEKWVGVTDGSGVQWSTGVEVLPSGKKGIDWVQTGQKQVLMDLTP